VIVADNIDAALDMSIESLHARPPLTRPAIATVGTSQIAKMELALGRRTWADGDVAYLRDETRVMKKSGHSRALLVAAGILEETKGHRKVDEGTEDEDESLTVGKAREAELFHTWASVVRSGWYANEFESQLDPDSLTYLPPPPPGSPRRQDPLCPALSTAGFDGFAHTHDGAFVHLELKTARYKHPFAKSLLPVWWDRGGVLPWWYARQNDASMAINCAGHSLLIVGGGWIRGENDPRGDGPIKVFYQRRDRARIDEARDIATATLAAVARLRTTAANAA
jgi:hypothetical protein